jgi:hypothetical protein
MKLAIDRTVIVIIRYGFGPPGITQDGGHPCHQDAHPPSKSYNFKKLTVSTFIWYEVYVNSFARKTVVACLNGRDGGRRPRGYVSKKSRDAAAHCVCVHHAVTPLYGIFSRAHTYTTYTLNFFKQIPFLCMFYSSHARMGRWMGATLKSHAEVNSQRSYGHAKTTPGDVIRRCLGPAAAWSPTAYFGLEK